MVNIFFDKNVALRESRAGMFDGDIAVLKPQPGFLGLASHADRMLREALAPHDPQKAQHSIEVSQFASVMAALKPRFVHSQASKEFLAQGLRDVGLDPKDTYFDVPKLRISTSSDYLTTGIAYAHHPHRDTWYGGLAAQLNWWIPIYPVQPGNGMEFFLEMFDKELPNDSDKFNYYIWNAERKRVGKLVNKDSRVQPRLADGTAIGPTTRLVPEVGGAIVFAAQHLHGTVPNFSGVTRFSIDFRTVSRADLEARVAAKTADTRCSGTAIRDFMRCSDLSRLPDELVEMYDNPAWHVPGGDLLFRPEA